ncbi:DUF5991 domain-containing protein [Chryseobacterium oncorhynchi]|uniref:Lipoprotein n=1 Tax=Chryseobacterium oncorhynchi TaxID=741074 RepID=A0A316WY66_9FLAO|nr:DUF5991 domain-containing protein [Chryseobacterium oncorhynchi]PWN66521.1 hypothetical protein C1638_009215 [Chryseobacterium oncorhynchi]
MIKYTIKISISLAIIVLLSCKQNTKTSYISTENVSNTVDTGKIINPQKVSDHNDKVREEARNQDTLKKWIGDYHFDVHGKGEREEYEYKINLNISKDSVIYYAEGYQLYQKFLLKVVENNNSLDLKYQESLDGTNSWALAKTHDFGKLYLKDGKYMWECPFLNISFTDNQKVAYLLNNKNNR